MSEPAHILPCPTCRKPTPWTPGNKYRPFCSERCRLIDFGEWADERRRIPGQPLEDVMSEDLDRERDG